MDEQGRTEDILFRDKDTGDEIKLMDTTGTDWPYAAIRQNAQGKREIYPYADIDIDTSAIQGRYVMRIYEKAKDRVSDHKGAVALSAAAIVTGVATAVTVVRHFKHKN